jgi:hypothetical protein
MKRWITNHFSRPRTSSAELVHEGGLPDDIEFINTDSLSVRAGGFPNYVLKISHGWFNWLVLSVK